MIKPFFDTNVVAYASDARYPEQCRVARELLERFIDVGVVSTQVLLELFSVLTRKMALGKFEAHEIVREIELYEVVPMSSDMAMRSIDLSVLHQISIWDAAMVVAAAQARCDVMLTEDLQHGRVYEGVRVVNPFLDV